MQAQSSDRVAKGDVVGSAKRFWRPLALTNRHVKPRQMLITIHQRGTPTKRADPCSLPLSLPAALWPVRVAADTTTSDDWQVPGPAFFPPPSCYRDM